MDTFNVIITLSPSGQVATESSWQDRWSVGHRGRTGHDWVTVVEERWSAGHCGGTGGFRVAMEGFAVRLQEGDGLAGT